MDNQNSKMKNILILFWVIFLLVTAFGVSSIIFKLSFENPVTELNRFHVIYNNEDKGEINIDELRSISDFGCFNKGDQICLTTSIPHNYMVFPTLLVQSQYCGIKIYIDRTFVQEKNWEEAISDKYIPVQTSFLSIPCCQLGKRRLTIELMVSEDNVTKIMESPVFGSYSDILRYFMHNRLFSISIGIFLLVFGTIFFNIILLFAAKVHGLLDQLVSSLIFINSGLWILAADQVFVVIPNIYPNSLFTIVSTHISLPLIVLLSALICKNTEKKSFKISLIIIGMAELAIFIFHMSGIMHINHVTLVYGSLYILFMTKCIVDAHIFMIEHKNKKNNKFTFDLNNVQIIGLIVLCLSLGFATVINAVNEPKTLRLPALSTSIFSFGQAIFIVSRLSTYLRSMLESFRLKEQQNELSQLAYEDSLTHMPNRTKCESIFQKYDENCEDYMIMSLDLNGLKEINDSGGHVMGDQLITDFSDILSKSFPKPFFSARVGGDEFVVALEKEPKEGFVDASINKMLKMLEEKEIETGIDHSAAYGICWKHELEKKTNCHEVYMVADERMYECKRMQHNQKAIG